MDFGKDKGGRQDSSSAFGSAPSSPVPPLILELLPSLLMKLCKGFRDLLEICWEAFYYYLFFLPVLGVGLLRETGEPVLSALCTTGVVYSCCKI